MFDVRAQDFGKDAPELAGSLTELAQAETALGDAGQAVAFLEHAVQLNQGPHIWAGQLADAQFNLARALAEAHGDLKKAHSLATSASAEFTQVHLTARANEVKAWLAAHPAP